MAFRRALICALLAVVGWAVAPAPAAIAHSDLVSSDPADGAELAVAPEVISLTFSEPVLPDFVRMVVTNADGEIGDLVVSSVQGETAAADWPPNLVPGTWTVTYRVVSQDGHPVEGQISFSYDSPAPSPTSASPDPSTASPSPTTAPPTTEPTPEPTSVPSTPAPTTPAPDTSPSDQGASPEASPAASTSSQSNTGWVIAGLAVLVLAAVAIVAVVARGRSR